MEVAGHIFLLASGCAYLVTGLWGFVKLGKERIGPRMNTDRSQEFDILMFEAEVVVNMAKED